MPFQEFKSGTRILCPLFKRHLTLFFLFLFLCIYILSGGGVTSCGRICKTCYLGRVMSPIGHVMCCMFVLFSCSHSLSLLQIANWVPADAHHSSVLSERRRNTQKYKTAKKQCQSADGYALTLCPDPELFSFVQCGRVWPLPLNFVN